MIPYDHIKLSYASKPFFSFAFAFPGAFCPCVIGAISLYPLTAGILLRGGVGSVQGVFTCCDGTLVQALAFGRLVLIEVGLAQGFDAGIDCRGWVAGCMGCIPAKAL